MRAEWRLEGESATTIFECRILADAFSNARFLDDGGDVICHYFTQLYTNG
jgi:hypothetical protein